MTLFRTKKSTKEGELPDPRSEDDVRSRLLSLELENKALRRGLLQMDYDLQDAIDGFYRRKQADRMREVREEEGPKRKRTTEKDILLRALRLSDDKHDSDDSHEKRD